MNLIQQPPGSSLCGQCVVAMLANAPLSEVIGYMGEGRSYPANIRKAARLFGVSLPSRSKPGTMEPPPGRGAAMIWGGRQHWVAWCDGFWFDPAKPHLLVTLAEYQTHVVALYPVQDEDQGPSK